MRQPNDYFCNKCNKIHISNMDKKDYRNHKKYAANYEPQRKYDPYFYGEIINQGKRS